MEAKVNFNGTIRVFGSPNCNTKSIGRENNRDDKRGTERIRTAVQAFAELCLATRPRCLICATKVIFYSQPPFGIFFKRTATCATSPLIGGFILATSTLAVAIR